MHFKCFPIEIKTFSKEIHVLCCWGPVNVPKAYLSGDDAEDWKVDIGELPSEA